MKDWSSGITLSERVSDLGAVFNEWLELYRRACESFPQTRDFWYIEPTLVGLLEAAAWRLDIPCVSEAKIQRRREASDHQGHADLMIQLGDNRVAAEAKIHWFNNLDGFEAVLGCLQSACTDVLGLNGERIHRRLGICFGIFEKGGESIDQLLRNSLNKAETEKVDVKAWNVLLSSSENIQYPGCLLIARLV